MVQDTNEDEDGASKGCGAKFNAWWKNFKLAIWNGEKKEFVGRTGWSWACILPFYAGYFFVTGGYFAICFSIFLTTIDDRVPTFQKHYSMLKFNPGMNYVPKWPLDSRFVGFNSSLEESYMKTYVPMIEREIERYANSTHDTYKLNITSLGECSKENKFGYPEGKPCILMRINNIYGWEPSGKLRDDMSKCLENVNENLKSLNNSEFIPVSCEGEEPIDQRNLIRVQFYPAYGIPKKAYPYYNQDQFLPPLVAAKFTIKRGVIVKINCRFWDSDVKHDVGDRQGSLHLELMYYKNENESTDSLNTTEGSFTATSASSRLAQSAETSPATQTTDSPILSSFTTHPTTASTADHSEQITEVTST